MTTKLNLTLLMILIGLSVSFAQLAPDNFYLQADNKALQKSLSANPLSNTITDIITIEDTIWLGTSRGVSLSTDNGANWTNFYGQSDFGEDNISAIGYYSGVFWCATAKSTEVTGGQTLPEGTGLKYTTNLGATWTNIPQPLDHPDSTTEKYGINTIQALPVTVAIQNLAYDIAFTPNTIWIATFAGGLRKSTDKGQTWKRVILPPDNLNSISPTDTLDFCLSPVGGNFCKNGNFNHRVFSVTTDNNGFIYVGTADGINKSTDGGISWIKFNAQNQQLPISGNFITALGFNQITNTLWASTWKANGPSEFYGVSSSTNGGETWNTFLRDEQPHNFGFKTSEVMVPTDNGVFRSNNNGLTWMLPNSIIDETTNSSTNIIFHTDKFYSAASYANYIWLGSSNGLARLHETANWQGTWKIYFVSQPLSSNDQTYCYPNPFNPRDQNVPLNFKYSTRGIEEYVSIRIFDFGFNYVRTVVQNVPRNFNLDSDPVDFWDGKDDNGNYVSNGVYFYRVEVGDNDAVYGKILVLQ